MLLLDPRELGFFLAKTNKHPFHMVAAIRSFGTLPRLPIILILVLSSPLPISGISSPRYEKSASSEVTYIIRDQKTSLVDKALCEELRQELLSQGVDPQHILRTSEFIDHAHLWVLLPLFKALSELGDSRLTPWYFFLEPETRVDHGLLTWGILASLDPQEAHFVAHVIKDQEPAIIHHYVSGVRYPFLPAGFAISSGLLEATTEYLKGHRIGIDFQIDASHELASFLQSRLQVKVSHSDLLCAKASEALLAKSSGNKKQRKSRSKEKGVSGKGSNGVGSATVSVAVGCASSYLVRSETAKRAKISFNLQPSEVLIAVKTTSKYHQTRLPVLMRTWVATSPVDVIFMSDGHEYINLKNSDSIKKSDIHPSFEVETVDLTKLWGIEINQKEGHCAKTDAILKYFEKYYCDTERRRVPMKKFLVIVDDDTLLNVEALVRLLDTHNPKVPSYIGERYGYGHRATDTDFQGYDYITMGGGVTLTCKSVIFRSYCEECKCPKPDTPDDMQLGLWMRHLGINATHESGFHQSQPHNYHPLVRGDAHDVNTQTSKSSSANHLSSVSYHRFAKLKDGSPGKFGDIDLQRTQKIYMKYLLGLGRKERHHREAIGMDLNIKNGDADTEAAVTRKKKHQSVNSNKDDL